MAGSKNVKAVEDKDFDAHVKEGMVLVDFGATWCGPCKALAPIIDKVADENVGKVKVLTVDIDDAPETAKKYAVKSVPMLVLFKNGQKSGSITGLTTKDKIDALLNG